MSTSLTPGIHLVTASTPNLPSIIDGIAHIHASCILYDGTLATFLPPLHHSQLYGWWEERAREVSRHQRQLIVHLSATQDRTSGNVDVVQAPWREEGKTWPVFQGSHPDGKDLSLEVSGVVSLSTPFSQTGPFRAIVEKLLVSPFHRRKGIARLMMAKLESVAIDLGRWNLLLDTTVGSDAEHVYPQLGYERLCVITEYGYSPSDGRLVDEVWFWKDLRRMKRLDQ